MRQIYVVLVVLIICTSCKNEETKNDIEGTWKMIYAETKQGDSIEIKDLSNTDFIKIINASHFVFINQDYSNVENFYSGGGTYKYQGKKYVETLGFTSVELIRNHEFPFTIKISGDTLIQKGLEEVKAAGIKREIIEKYIKIN
ncbi:hypothetical protein FBALC1_16832 [Flavobacteriales bacterium ALC-1]|nr:hypothetical protein FBALC1_16832 [Flavobacteriales bacterium ALC-1]